MSHLDYHMLINLGRKAGLNTSELYRALSTRPLDRQMSESGQTDCNGYTGVVSSEGKTEYRPTNPRR